jgi:hypothetical protein
VRRVTLRHIGAMLAAALARDHFQNKVFRLQNKRRFRDLGFDRSDTAF